MLAIDPMTIANGCVRFVDGSHTGGPQPHVHVDSASFSLAIDGSPTAFPEATPVECEPGDAVFFGPLVRTLPHPPLRCRVLSPLTSFAIPSRSQHGRNPRSEQSD